MKYLCLVYHTETVLAAMPAADMQGLVDAHLDYDDVMRRSGHFLLGQALQSTDTAVTVRVRSGKLSVTDGPFAETKEQLSGIILIEAPDLDDAIRVASRIPSANLGTIEVRPVWELTRSEPHRPATDGPVGDQIRERVDALYRSDSRRVLATLIRLLGDFDLAEEALHDAFAAAVERWPASGVPANPRAWLVSTGRFKAIDSLRRRARFDASVAHIADRLGARAGRSPHAG